jgi:CheY-like chemotaxis protein
VIPITSCGGAVVVGRERLLSWVLAYTESREADAMSRQSASSVLCIGNDPVALNLRCSLLRAQGWAVRSSGSGHEGVILFQREKVDLVVVDLNGDGAEAALITSSLKQIRPEVPIVLVVADETALANGATQQAAAVVAKSEESARLHGVLTGLVSGR